MHDGAPSHKSTKTKRFIEEDLKLPLFYHPPMSPDLNPIGDVWGILKKKLRARSEHATSIRQLTDAVRQAWNDITQEEINHVIETMEARKEAIKANSGGHTTY